MLAKKRGLAEQVRTGTQRKLTTSSSTPATVKRTSLIQTRALDGQVKPQRTARRRPLTCTKTPRKQTILLLNKATQRTLKSATTGVPLLASRTGRLISG